MFFFAPRRVAILAIISVFVGSRLGMSCAEDFRIESRVYVDDEKKPLQTSTTLFKGGTVYNFVGDSPEITVLDRGAQRIVVLHEKLKLRAEITAEQLDEFTGKIRGYLARSRREHLQFLSRPVFDESFNPANGTLKMASKLLTYEVEGEPCEDDETLAAYREFSDWQSQFNVRMNASATPFPLARLPLNEALERRKIMPTRVARKTEGIDKTPAMRSEHDVLLRLLGADQKRIDDTDERLVEFTQVDLETYLVRVRQLDGGQPAAAKGK